MNQFFWLLLLSLPIFSYSTLFASVQYKEVAKMIQTRTLESLEVIANQQQNPELLRAIHATKILQAKYTSPGIDKYHFLEAAYYIETHLPLIKAASNHYFIKSKTGLRHDIEHDPISGHTFIVLKSKSAFIGRGKKKSVYKTIHYGQDPKVLARSQQSVKMNDEIQAHKDLLGVPGVMNAHAFTKHTRNNKKYYAIYSDFYKGTLSSLLQRNELDIRNKLLIMCDLLSGLESLHAQEYVHRDLHGYNYLYFEESLPSGQKLIRAVISDLGRTIKISQAKQVRAQMTSRLCPPEGFDQGSLKGKDYFATDIYALGCVLHRIYHHKFPKWQGNYLKSDQLSLSKKKAMLIKKLEQEAGSKRSELMRKKTHGSLSPKEQIELLILQMLHVNPSKRPTAAELKGSMQYILQRYG